MDESGRKTEHRPIRVTGRLTRRPTQRKRRYALYREGRFRGLGDLADSPGLGHLADFPVIGPIIIGLFALLLLTVLLGVFGGFLIAFIELTLLGLTALAGSLWAWLRRHPKVAVIDVDEQRWVRDEGPVVDLVEDQQSIQAGTDPAVLGYRPLP